MKAPFPWIGGKGKLLWLIHKLFPSKIKCFVDVFGGSGTVLLSRPLKKGCVEIYNDFNSNLTNFTGKTKGHSGMDLAVPTGTPIRAALPGTVTVSTYNQGGYGYYVMIDHGGGLVTLYGHCSQLIARVGRTVQAGDVIALSGSTGRSTGPHLHFEVRVNGERTNPRSYLP